MKPLLRFHPGPLVALAAIVLALCTTLAFAQLPARSGTSPPAAFKARPGARPVAPAAPAVTPVPVLPGTGSTALPPTAPAPAGLAPVSPFPAGLPSPLPFPAGTPSTAIAAPGTSAAITGPSTAVKPDAAGAAGTVITVPSSSRGVVIVPGSTPAPIGTTGQPVPVGTVGAPDPGNMVNAGAATVGAGGTVVMPATGGYAGGLTGGTPSVSPQATVAVGGPLTALQIAQFFQQADADRDGLLSRAEAPRLPLVTMTFEDMDRNRDGSVSRSEYSDSLQ